MERQINMAYMDDRYKCHSRSPNCGKNTRTKHFNTIYFQLLRVNHVHTVPLCTHEMKGILSQRISFIYNTITVQI